MVVLTCQRSLRLNPRLPGSDQQQTPAAIKRNNKLVYRLDSNSKCAGSNTELAIIMCDNHCAWAPDSIRADMRQTCLSSTVCWSILSFSGTWCPLEAPVVALLFTLFSRKQRLAWQQNSVAAERSVSIFHSRFSTAGVKGHTFPPAAARCSQTAYFDRRIFL